MSSAPKSEEHGHKDHVPVSTDELASTVVTESVDVSQSEGDIEIHNQTRSVSRKRSVEPLEESKFASFSLSIVCLFYKKDAYITFCTPDDRTLWRDRTFWQDITQTYLNDFVEFSRRVVQIRKENLLELAPYEKAESLYNDLMAEQNVKKALSGANNSDQGWNSKEAIHQEIWRMTKYGTIKYGMQLCIMEICTLGSIFVFKLMIDYLQEMKEN